MKILIAADPIATLHQASDSSLVMAQDALRRGFEVFYATKDQLLLTNQGAFVQEVLVKAQRLTASHPPVLEPPQTLALKDFKVALMRYDPPFDMAYYSATRILASSSHRCLVVNDPKAVLLEPEKLLPFEVAGGKFCPPSLITADLRELQAFGKIHKQVVLKPLYGKGGTDIVAVSTPQQLTKVATALLAGEPPADEPPPSQASPPQLSPSQSNPPPAGKLPHSPASPTSTEGIPPSQPSPSQANHPQSAPPQSAPVPVVAQKLIPEVTQEGDRRCFIINGKFKGGFARLPQKGSILANLAQGGRAQKCQFSAKEKQICEEVAEVLQQKNILFGGVDLIKEQLVEINITSPTGLCEHHALYGTALEIELWDSILAML